MRVSVLIPTHNRVAMVCEAIESVLAQTEPAVEIVVVDDGSTDETAPIVGERFEGRIRIIRQPQSGVGAARNRAIHDSHEEWIAFLDSDDLWHPDKLKIQLAWHRRHPQFRASQTVETWTRNGVHVKQRRHQVKQHGDLFEASLESCCIAPSAVLLHRSVFAECGVFDESLEVCEDYELWLRLTARHPVGLVPESLITRRSGHEDQLSSRHWGMDRFRVAALTRLLATVELSTSQREAAVRELGRKCLVLATGARRRGLLEHARRYELLAEWSAGL